MDKNFKQLLNNIRCFMFDVDGVLTNGSLIVMPGELYRVMNIRDGFALKTAVDSGFLVIVITGGKSESVKSRLNKLGINEVYIGVDNKIELFKEVVKKHNLKKEEILYMGDDLPDWQVMKKSGVPCCPFDAAHEIREISLYVSPQKGGEGCVRDVIEQVLRLKGKWPEMKV